jgi:aminoglycoside phosphotransferase
VSVALYCGMVPGYPAEKPLLTGFQNEQGLGGTHLEELVEVGKRAAVENLGMPSIFMVAEAAKEWLQMNNLPGLDGSMYSGRSTFIY